MTGDPPDPTTLDLGPCGAMASGGPTIGARLKPANASNGPAKKLVIKPLKGEPNRTGAASSAARRRPQALLPCCNVPLNAYPVGCCGNLRLVLAVKPELPSNFEEVTWAKLQDAINAVQCKRPVACSLEELYRVGGGDGWEVGWMGSIGTMLAA